jgi:hypothetical protein
MSTTYTTNVKLGEPAIGDTGWGATLNNAFSTLDALAPVGHMAVSTHEVPSVSLQVDIAAGAYVKQDTSVGTFNATTVALGASNTWNLYLDGTSSFALVSNQTSWPSTAHVRLAIVVTGGTTITSITDARKFLNVVGTWAEGTNISLGTSTGTQIGTASTQKLGFLGAAPAVQQTGGAATASGSYTATEQGMLQKAYNALRTFGLLS